MLSGVFIMGKINWIEGQPPTNERTYLFKFNSGIICSGEYRYGRKGEPQENVLAWRCDCCGRFATPMAWAVIDR
jgi:hypothetical protein